MAPQPARVLGDVLAALAEYRVTRTWIDGGELQIARLRFPRRILARAWFAVRSRL